MYAEADGAGILEGSKQVNAREARATANKQAGLDGVMKKIESQARAGKYRAVFLDDEWPGRVVQEALESLGFKVDVHPLFTEVVW